MLFYSSDHWRKAEGKPQLEMCRAGKDRLHRTPLNFNSQISSHTRVLGQDTPSAVQAW